MYFVCVWADMSWCICGGQKAACGSQLCPTTRVLWTESVTSLVGPVLTCRDYLLALLCLAGPSRWHWYLSLNKQSRTDLNLLVFGELNELLANRSYLVF